MEQPESRASPPEAPELRPHRGTLIVVLAALGLCFIPVIPSAVAWFLARKDLKDMDAGVRDPAGRSMVRIYKALAVLGFWLGVILIVLAPFAWRTLNSPEFKHFFGEWF